MTAQSAGATSAPGTGALEPGTSLGDRFKVERLLGTTPLFQSYLATDTESGGPALLMLIPGGANEQAIASARSGLAIEHRNLARMLAADAHGSDAYLAYEFHDGHSLRQLLERKQATGGGAFNPKGALNILSHVTAGLSAVHGSADGAAHGGLGLDTITVNKAGRVVITGMGLHAFVGAAARAKRLPPWPTFAPEITQGRSPTPAADVYALGALAYMTLVGAPPVKGCKRPSEVVAGLGASVDQLVGSSMHPSPAKRPASAEAFGKLFREAVITGRPSAAQPAQPAPSERSAAGRPSLAQEIVAAPQESAAVSAALSAALADTEERFLINMGNLDYGPFTLQQVVDRIHSGEVRRGHVIIDKDTGNRQNVEDNPLLHDLVEEAQLRRDEERRAAAEVAHASQEKRRGVALYVFILAGVLGLGGGAYLLVSKLAAGGGGDDPAEVAALEQGSLKVKINPIKVDKKKRRRSGKRRGKSPSGGTAGGWDDSLSMDMAEGGGSERLDDSQINPVIQRHGGRLGGCLSKTGSRYADIDFIIVGSGKVSQVRVNGKTSGALANCIRGAMKRMKFPSFNGPRTKANFNMSL